MFGSERLTGALLDRLTPHVHILEMDGESYRLRQSRKTNENQTEHEAWLSLTPRHRFQHHNVPWSSFDPPLPPTLTPALTSITVPR